MAAEVVCHHGTRQVLGVSIRDDTSAICVTVQEDAVYTYELDSTSPSSTTSLAHQGLDLACSARYSAEGSTLFAALTDRTSGSPYAVRWTPNRGQNTLARAAKDRLLLPSTPRSVFCLTRGNGKDMGVDGVVLEDGKIACCHWASQTVESKDLDLPQDCTCTASFANLLLTASQSVCGRGVHLCLYACVSGGLSEKYSWVVQSPMKQSELVEVSLQGQGMCMIWSDGSIRWFEHDFRNATSPPVASRLHHLGPFFGEQTSSMTTPHKDRKRKPPPPVKVAASRLCCSACPSGAVVVARAAANGEEVAVRHAAFDLRTGCVLSSREDPLPGCSSIAGQQQLIAVPNDPTRFVYVVGGGVYLLQREAPRTDLASMVGIMSLKSQCYKPIRDTQVLVPANGGVHQVQVTCTPQSLLLGDEGASLLPREDGAASMDGCVTVMSMPEGALGVQLELGERGPGGREAAQASSIVLDAVAGHLPPSDVLTRAVELAVTASQHGMLLELQVLSRLAEMLVLSSLWSQLDILLQHHPLSSLGKSQDLLEKLAAAGEYPLMLLLCQRLTAVPAKAVVGAVARLLTPGSDHERSTQKAAATSMRRKVLDKMDEVRGEAPGALRDQQLVILTHYAAAYDGFSPREICLHGLLYLPLDFGDLHVALKVLTSRQMSLLLRYLGKWVKKYGGDLAGAGEVDHRDPFLRFPSFKQVLEWLMCCLGAHMTPLMMDSTSGKLLSSLQDEINMHVEASEKLVALEGMLQQLSGPTPLPEGRVQSSRMYTVELMDLHVEG